jgi:PAS domain S-box-containing protein
MERNTAERTPPDEMPGGDEQKLNAAILDTCPVVIHAKDTQGRYLLVNRQWEALANLSRDQVKGKTDFDLFPEERATACRDLERRVLEAGRVVVSEVSVTVGNERRNYESLKFPIVDASGTTWAIGGISIDITERKRAEEALHKAREELEARAGERTTERVQANEQLQSEITHRAGIEQRLQRSEEYYRALIENAMDIVAVLEADGTVRYASPAVERVLGYAPAERPGKTIDAFVHPDDLPALKKALSEALQGRRHSAAIEYRYRHKDGSWRVIESAARNLLNDPAVNGIVVNSRDVTERRRAEEALRQKEAELRDNQLQLRALAARLLTGQDEEWSRIARELHDDLNQKLAFLAVDVEMLEKQLPESPTPVRERLRSLQHRAVELSEDVRRMAHRLHPAVLDDLGLDPALRSYCAEFSALAGIPVKFSCPKISESLPPDVALCLYRVAQEGLQNIAKHSRASRATVTLAGAADVIDLSIADSGVGFSADAVRGKGGLGLVSMEERVRLVNGSLMIESAPGKGTRIKVRVPLPRRTDETPPAASGG